jgi:hypothetical protein
VPNYHFVVQVSSPVTSLALLAWCAVVCCIMSHFCVPLANCNVLKDRQRQNNSQTPLTGFLIGEIIPNFRFNRYVEQNGNYPGTYQTPKIQKMEGIS